MVTADGDTKARIWDVASGRLLATLEGHTGEVVDAEFSPDGSRVVTASWDGTAKIWDVQSLIGKDGDRPH
jgi:WD40 repeat protein